MGIKDKTMKLATDIYVKFSGVAQEKIERDQEKITVTDEMKAILRKTASEGAVLLKNNGVLPLKKDEKISIFGRVQYNWFYTGYGSGGDVNRPYQVNLIDGIRNCDALNLNENLAQKYENWCKENVINDSIWGMWPRFYPEMPIDENDVKDAKEVSDVAVVVIGRSSGEDRENALEKGSFFLTDEEKLLLKIVTDKFENTVVVLNIGSVIDFSFIDEFSHISAVLLAWQGGMESGNAVADLLSGKVNPSGKLTSTVAKKYSDIPSADYFGGKDFNNYTEDIYVGYRYFETFNKSAVMFPFGFGLSYTSFNILSKAVEGSDDGFKFKISVENTGDFSGKEVVQLYVKKPMGDLGNPQKELVAFFKTDLLNKNEIDEKELFVSFYQLSSFDDSGVTGNKNSYVLLNGEYDFYLGNSVRNCEKIFTYYHEKNTVISSLLECLAPKSEFDVFYPEVNGDKISLSFKRCTVLTVDLKQRIIENIPKAISPTGDKGYKLSDVKSGKISIDEFIAQLNLDELEALSRGDFTMDSPLGVKGNAGVYGGILPSLKKKGVPRVTTTDGPSGIRLRASCSLIPIGTLLASTFDVKIVQELYSLVAKEMKEKGSDILLAPGMNIQRNPLCGRNFEYYSEDPYLTGKIGAAAVMGIQSHSGSACPKHFACNNQETKRLVNDSRVSQRALREIYLKGFEICVKEAKPKNIMTSYNKINGEWSYYNYDLATSILRNEWGYEGVIITDWWTKKGKSPHFKKVFDQAYRVRSGVNVLMPGGNRLGKRKADGTLLKYLDKGGITLGEVQNNAKYVLKFLLNSGS